MSSVGDRVGFGRMAAQPAPSMVPPTTSSDGQQRERPCVLRHGTPIRCGDPPAAGAVPLWAPATILGAVHGDYTRSASSRRRRRSPHQNSIAQLVSSIGNQAAARPALAPPSVRAPARVVETKRPNIGAMLGSTSRSCDRTSVARSGAPKRSSRQRQLSSWQELSRRFCHSRLGRRTNAGAWPVHSIAQIGCASPSMSL
jgi:hypothetical protein